MCCRKSRVPRHNSKLSPCINTLTSEAFESTFTKLLGSRCYKLEFLTLHIPNSTDFYILFFSFNKKSWRWVVHMHIFLCKQKMNV